MKTIGVQFKLGLRGRKDSPLGEVSIWKKGAVMKHYSAVANRAKYVQYAWNSFVILTGCCLLTSCASTPSYETDMANAKKAIRNNPYGPLDLFMFWRVDGPNWSEAAIWYDKAARDATNTNDSREAAALADGARRAANQTTYVAADTSGDPFKAQNDIYAANMAAIRARQNNQLSGSLYTPPPNAAIQNSGGTGAMYDNALDQCVKLGDDRQSVYFDNGCNASLTIMEYQTGHGGVGSLDCAAGTRCTFMAFAIGYSARQNFSYAVCPKGDYIESSPGIQWAGAGSFRCRRP
jgi:hypothetical protein